MLDESRIDEEGNAPELWIDTAGDLLEAIRKPSLMEGGAPSPPSGPSGADSAAPSKRPFDLVFGYLLSSRDSLSKIRCDTEDDLKAPPSPRCITPQDRSYRVEVMLVGFAAENLLKALWLVRGNAMYAGGKLRKMKNVANHDLAAIADHVGFLISVEERRVLVGLSNVMTGIGRYPLGAHPDLEMTESWSNTEDDVAFTMIHRLRDLTRKGTTTGGRLVTS